MIRNDQLTQCESLNHETISQIPSFDDLDLWDCLNSHGEVRTENVKDRFDLNDPEDRIKLIRLYMEWVRQNDYIVLECELDNEKTYHVKKCSKRGNDVDMRYAERRLKHVGLCISGYADYDKTRALKMTMTIDPSRYGHDINAAWKTLGEELNRFRSTLIKRYGDVLMVRGFESHESGYPHIHAIVCFKKQRWIVVGKDKNDKWRIPYSMKKEIEDLWGLGYLDIQAIVPESVNKAIEDSVWYIIKSKKEGDYRSIETWSMKRLLTLSIMWYLGKRGWSASRELCKKPDDLKSNYKIIQTDIEGNDLFDCSNRAKWRFVGMIRGLDIDLDPNVWEKIYPKPPDWLNQCWTPKRMKSVSSPLKDMGFA